MPPVHAKRFKPTVSGSEALGDRRATTIDLRKKKKDEVMRKIRMPEKQQAIQTVQQATSCSPAKALEAIEQLRALPETAPHPKLFESMTLCLEGIRFFRRNLTKQLNQGFIDDCVQHGLLGQFLFVLHVGQRFPNLPQLNTTVAMLQLEAAWCLTNIAASHAKQILDIDMSLPFLGQVIQGSQFSNAREQAIWCVANLGGYEDASYRKKILWEESIVKGIVKNVLQFANPSILCTSLWALGNLMQGSPPPGLQNVQQILVAILKTFEHFCVLPQSEDRDKVLDEILTACRKAMGDDHEVVNFVADPGYNFVPHAFTILREACDRKSDVLAIRVMRCLVELVHGNEEMGEIFMKENFFAIANKLMEVANPYLVKEICLVLQSLLKHSSDRVKQFGKHRNGSLLFHIAKSANKFKSEVKVEAYHVLFIYLNQGDRIDITRCLDDLFGKVVIPSVLNLECDVSLILAALDSINRMFSLFDQEELCDRLFTLQVVERIQHLQNHKNEEVYKKAYNIIDKYFTEPDDEEDIIVGEAPPAENSSFGFGLHKLATTPQSTILQENQALFSFPAK